MIAYYYVILFCAILGLASGYYFYQSRSKVEVEEDDPSDHIRGMYLLKVPYELVVIGFFGIIALTYTIKIFTHSFIDELDLAMFLLSMAAVLILLYKFSMGFTDIAGGLKWSTVVFLVLNIIISISIYLQVPDMIELFQAAREYTLTLHLLGMVLGLGGTTILDFMIFHFLRNYKISSEEAVIMHLVSQLIIIGLVFLLVSGVALFLSDAEGYLASDRFLMKMTALGVVIINGGVLNLYITPSLEKISLLKEDWEKNEKLKKAAFAVGAISMVSWYAAFFFAMIKDLGEFSYVTLLIPYLLLLGAAVGISQFMKKKMEKEVIEEQ
jgi:hypothetical protein